MNSDDIDLSCYSIEELHAMMDIIPSMIADKERNVDNETESRKKRLHLEFQALAAKQGLDF